MRKLRFKTCFISAPAGADTSVLRTALDELSIRWFDVVSTRPGHSLRDTLELAIARSDFVCAVIPANCELQNTFFELGIALGKGRPLLLFVEKGVILPSTIQELQYALVESWAPEAIKLHLRAFLEHARLIPSSTRPRLKGLKKIDSRQALRELKSFEADAGVNYRGTAFENFVSNLFAKSGAIVSLHPPDDRGTDLALWIDELEPVISNPLLVETKWGQINIGNLMAAETQLRSYLGKAPARVGLVVYYDILKRSYPPVVAEWPLVIRLSIEELIQLLAEGQFVSRIREWRNQVAHGVL